LGSFSAKVELAKTDYKPTPEERKQSDQWYDDPVEFLKELHSKPYMFQTDDYNNMD